MPRKMSGIAISVIDASSVASSTASVVLERTIHLYRSPRGALTDPTVHASCALNRRLPGTLGLDGSCSGAGLR